MNAIHKKHVSFVINENRVSIENIPLFRAFTDEKITIVQRFLQTYEHYMATPLYRLDRLAKQLELAEIRVKDESFRFHLNAFKAVGGVYAMAKHIATKLNEPIEQLSFEYLQSEEVRRRVGDVTFITATDGNHGRGVAWAAKALGYRAVVYMPKGSSIYRLNAIKAEGADAYIADFNYDDCVRYCEQLAKEHDWIILQDTAWEGYEDIPIWIMQGYAAIAKEITAQLPQSQPPTHIFLQAGVGSFASAIAAYFVQYYAKTPPQIFVVEPNKADCYYQSFQANDAQMHFVTGDMDTIMAGLACGEPNQQAYQLLQSCATGAFSCDDKIAALGMRIYGNPVQDDPHITSGESGAVTLGLIYYLRKLANDPVLSETLQLNEQSRVLLINTEGDTDPVHYQQVVWEGTYGFSEEDV